MGTILLAIFLFLAGLIVYLVMRPNVPDGLEKPGTLRLIQIVMIVFDAVSRFKAMFSSSFMEHFKKTTGLLENMRPKLPQDIKDKFKIEEITVDGVPARKYIYTIKSENSEMRPGFIYLHGGGWAMGELDAYDLMCLKISETCGAAVISLDYRLTNPDIGQCFPVPFDDCYNASKYILNNSEDFGMDGSRIAIGGDSAGGNLAAAVCLKLRDEKVNPAPMLQALIYPALQCIDLNQPSYQQNSDGLLLSGRLMSLFWSIYATGQERYASVMLRNQHVPEDLEDFLDHNGISKQLHYSPYKPKPVAATWESDLGNYAHVLQNPYFAPLTAKSLSRLPEAYIFTAQHDVLRDDGFLYARRLKEAGVKVTHKHCEIGFHGMFPMYKIVPEAQPYADHLCELLKDRFTN